MDVAMWNTLHDGRVSAADGAVPGDVRLSIEIAYLCRHLPTQAQHLSVTLGGCEQFEYQPHDGPKLDAPSAVAALGLDVLTARINGGCVRVECADRGAGGSLVLRYASAQIQTAEGCPLSQAEIEEAAERYWSLWEQRRDEPGATADGGDA